MVRATEKIIAKGQEDRQPSAGSIEGDVELKDGGVHGCQVRINPWLGDVTLRPIRVPTHYPMEEIGRVWEETAFYDSVRTSITVRRLWPARVEWNPETGQVRTIERFSAGG